MANHAAAVAAAAKIILGGKTMGKNERSRKISKIS